MKPSKNDYAIIKHLCSLTQPELLKQMYQYLQKKYKKTWRTDYAVFAEGTIPITLVAHCDTVFASPPEEFYLDSKKCIMWSPQGLGADDRAGIFAILDIVARGFRPNILLVTDEEVGCEGALQVVQEYQEAPFPTNFIIELDRCGRKDCVFYNCNNPEFIKYIESFGFVTKHGSFSDISMLAPNWGMAAVNLSIGYYNEHSYQEYLNVQYLLEVVEKVIKILIDKELRFFEYIDKIDTFAYSWYNNTVEDINQCICCGKEYADYDLLPIDYKGTKAAICLDCLTNAPVEWCENCNSLFWKTKDSRKINICDTCKGEMNNGERC